MRALFIFILSSLMTFPQINREDIFHREEPIVFHADENGIGNIRLGMDINRCLPNFDGKKNVYDNVYNIDENGNYVKMEKLPYDRIEWRKEYPGENEDAPTYLSFYLRDELMFNVYLCIVKDPYCYSGYRLLVKKIDIISPGIRMSNGIHTGMKLSELQTKYNARLMYEECGDNYLDIWAEYSHPSSYNDIVSLGFDYGIIDYSKLYGQSGGAHPLPSSNLEYCRLNCIHLEWDTYKMERYAGNHNWSVVSHIF